MTAAQSFNLAQDSIPKANIKWDAKRKTRLIKRTDSVPNVVAYGNSATSGRVAVKHEFSALLETDEIMKLFCFNMDLS